MNLKVKLGVLMIVALPLVASSSCKTRVNTRNRVDEAKFPHTVLWAWERPEDLEFVDPKRFAVAFLAQTLVLKGDDVVFTPRRQPLKVSPETRLIAVTRIESQKVTGERPALSPAQSTKLVALVRKTLDLGNVSAIQIDFDATTSERDFYRTLLQDLRRALPDNVPLSMTALASFCVGDRWLTELPVDEAVPMIFRMGADDKVIRNLLKSGEDFHEPICRRSYGIAVDEPLDANLDKSRRLYIFNSRPWTAKDAAPFLDEK
jgi:hypothetical protein